MLKLYGISSLNPESWENVDHETEGPLAGTMTAEDGGLTESMDPLGLRGRLGRGSEFDLRTSVSLVDYQEARR